MSCGGGQKEEERGCHGEEQNIVLWVQDSLLRVFYLGGALWAFGKGSPTAQTDIELTAHVHKIHSHAKGSKSAVRWLQH